MWNLWTVAVYGFYSSDSIHGCEMSLWTLWITRSHSHGLNCFDRYRIQAHHKRYRLHLFVSTLLNKLLIFIGSTNYSIEAQNKKDYFPISTIRRKTVLPYILVHNWIGMELEKKWRHRLNSWHKILRRLNVKSRLYTRFTVQNWQYPKRNKSYILNQTKQLQQYKLK